MTGVTIPSSVTSIGSGAFAYCDSLTSIVIPGSVTNLGSEAFAYCYSLRGVYFQGNAPAPSDDPTVFDDISATAYYLAGTNGWGPTFNGLPTRIYDSSQLIFTVNADNTLTVSGYAGTGGDVVIPGSVGEMPVVSIGSYAFYNCSSLTSITIPGSVTNIGFNAFYYCTGLTNVTLLDGVTSIGDQMFLYCTNLASVTIPGSVASIGSYAFIYCSNLTGVYFQGNAPTPTNDNAIFFGTHAIAYYLPGTTGWGLTFNGIPTVALLATKPPVIQDNQITLNWTAMSGKTCRVEYRADLTAGSWEVVTNLMATQVNMSVTLPVMGNQGFYRVGMEP